MLTYFEARVVPSMFPGALAFEVTSTVDGKSYRCGQVIDTRHLVIDGAIDRLFDVVKYKMKEEIRKDQGFK